MSTSKQNVPTSKGEKNQLSETLPVNNCCGQLVLRNCSQQPKNSATKSGFILKRSLQILPQTNMPKPSHNPRHSKPKLIRVYFRTSHVRNFVKAPFQRPKHARNFEPNRFSAKEVLRNQRNLVLFTSKLIVIRHILTVLHIYGKICDIFADNYRRYHFA